MFDKILKFTELFPLWWLTSLFIVTAYSYFFSPKVLYKEDIRKILPTRGYPFLYLIQSLYLDKLENLPWLQVLVRISSLWVT